MSLYIWTSLVAQLVKCKGPSHPGLSDPKFIWKFFENIPFGPQSVPLFSSGIEQDCFWAFNFSFKRVRISRKGNNIETENRPVTAWGWEWN